MVSGRTAAAIAASIEHSLHTGKKRPGEALPTVRDLATTLGVSPATVYSAYKLLRSRGLVAGHGRRGTRVAPGSAPPAQVAPPAVPAGTVDLATGNPDPVLLAPLGLAIRSFDGGQRMYGGEPDLAGLAASCLSGCFS